MNGRRINRITYGSDVGFLGATYDVAPDGQRFLMIKEAASGTSDPFAGLTQIYVVLNWHQERMGSGS